MVVLLHQIRKVIHQDVAISVDVLKAILAIYEAELLDSTVTWGRKRKVIMYWEAYLMLFRGALSGGEVLLIEGRELVKIVNNKRLDTAAPHVVLPLMGWIMG